MTGGNGFPLPAVGGISADADSLPGVLGHHVRHLRASGLTDETIKAAGIYSETSIIKLASLLEWSKPAKHLTPCIVFPFRDTDGGLIYSRIRPDVPRKEARTKRAIKYESPRGRGNRLYLPPGVAAYFADTMQELLVTEGEKKSLAATQFGFPCIGLVGVHGWKVKDQQSLIIDFDRIKWNGRKVYIAFDSDAADNQNVVMAETWLAKHLADRGANVFIVRIPAGEADADGNVKKVGVDDLLVAGGPRALRELMDAAEPPALPEGSTAKLPAGGLDPATEGKRFLESGKQDGVYRFRFWRGGPYWYSLGRYAAVPPSEVRARLTINLNEGFSHLTETIVSNVLGQVKAQALLPFGYEPPCWLGDAPAGWEPKDCVVCKNGIVHLPTLVAGRRQFEYMRPATPRFFTMSALDYDFAPDAPKPQAWLAFLKSVWENDPECIAELQKWFGLSLVVDTSFHKILMLIGPTRCGKGTVARVLTGVIGKDNVAGPTLASLATNFGLWPLLGKTLAVFSDARLGNRTDQSVVTERLLSISGEDGLTVDRKNLEPVTGKLLTRLMILSNELPRLTDASGALIGRMVLLPMTESFYGKEDRLLTTKLLTEREGILLWAIEGWRRLRDQGFFIQPKSGEDLLGEMRSVASPVTEFAADYCTTNPGDSIPVKRLFAAWRHWCKRHNQKPGTEQLFGRDLRAACSRIRISHPRQGEERIRVYCGIGLNPQGEAAADEIERQDEAETARLERMERVSTHRPCDEKKEW